MDLLVELSTTLLAAWLGGLFYLFEDQRPRHRPFSRKGWSVTVVTGLWIAVVTTLGVIALTQVLPAVPPQALAAVAPVGTKAAKAGATRKQALDQPTLVQKFSTLGVSLALEFLDGKLSAQKDRQVELWARSGLTHEGLTGLGLRADARLADRRLPGSQGQRKLVGDRVKAYGQAYEALERASDVRQLAMARQRVAVAAEDLLGAIFEVRLDRLIAQAATPHIRSSLSIPLPSESPSSGKE